MSDADLPLDALLLGARFPHLKSLRLIDNLGRVFSHQLLVLLLPPILAHALLMHPGPLWFIAEELYMVFPSASGVDLAVDMELGVTGHHTGPPGVRSHFRPNQIAHVKPNDRPDLRGERGDGQELNSFLLGRIHLVYLVWLWLLRYQLFPVVVMVVVMVMMMPAALFPFLFPISPPLMLLPIYLTGLKQEIPT